MCSRIILLFLFLGLFTSCATRLRIPLSDRKSIDSLFSGVFHAVPFQTKGITSDHNLLSLFDGFHRRIDTVHAIINSQGFLRFSFKEKSQNRVLVIKGELRKGYYQYFVSNERRGIPLINRVIKINRVRVILLKDNNLVIDNYWNHGASMFLLLASGSSGRGQYFFKPLR